MLGHVHTRGQNEAVKLGHLFIYSLPMGHFQMQAAVCLLYQPLKYQPCIWGRDCLKEWRLLVKSWDKTKDNFSSVFTIAAFLGDSVYVKTEKKYCVLIHKTELGSRLRSFKTDFFTQECLAGHLQFARDAITFPHGVGHWAHYRVPDTPVTRGQSPPRMTDKAPTHVQNTPRGISPHRTTNLFPRPFCTALTI